MHNDIIVELFEEYFANKDSNSISIEQMKDDLGDMVDKIVLYGAGSAGIAFLHSLNDAGVFPVCFADGDEDKCGNMCEGLMIIRSSEIVNTIGEDALVIVTINTDGKKFCRSFSENLRRGGAKCGL